MEQPTETTELKANIQRILGKEITELTLKGKGECNYAFYAESSDGDKYIIKQEREQKLTEDQNDLVVEGNLIKRLYDANVSVHVPRVIFVEENPKLYCYEYIEGDLMRGVWPSLSEEERISICRDLGRFHAEIGMKFTKEMSQESGIDINPSTGQHPKVIEQYNKWIADPALPEDVIDLVKRAEQIFDGTSDKSVFQFLHNDGHHENIIVKDKKISGIIDFGDSEYGEVAKEFSRYIRDYPLYFHYIVDEYEKVSGNKLSYERLVNNALVSGFNEIAEDYLKGGEDRKRAEEAIEMYRRLNSKTAFL
ncbi:MAG: aminoglycoside phosphotransferase family protein [Patescibacteria group bacterium]